MQIKRTGLKAGHYKYSVSRVRPFVMLSLPAVGTRSISTGCESLNLSNVEMLRSDFAGPQDDTGFCFRKNSSKSGSVNFCCVPCANVFSVQEPSDTSLSPRISA